MSRDWRVRLEDIVQYAGEAITFVAGMSFDAFAALVAATDAEERPSG